MNLTDKYNSRIDRSKYVLYVNIVNDFITNHKDGKVYYKIYLDDKTIALKHPHIRYAHIFINHYDIARRLNIERNTLRAVLVKYNGLNKRKDLGPVFITKKDALSAIEELYKIARLPYESL